MLRKLPEALGLAEKLAHLLDVVVVFRLQGHRVDDVRDELSGQLADCRGDELVRVLFGDSVRHRLSDKVRDLWA